MKLHPLKGAAISDRGSRDVSRLLLAFTRYNLKKITPLSKTGDLQKMLNPFQSMDSVITQ
jgi:hypothetical protein